MRFPFVKVPRCIVEQRETSRCMSPFGFHACVDAFAVSVDSVVNEPSNALPQKPAHRPSSVPSAARPEVLMHSRRLFYRTQTPTHTQRHHHHHQQQQPQQRWVVLDAAWKFSSVELQSAPPVISIYQHDPRRRRRHKNNITASLIGPHRHNWDEFARTRTQRCCWLYAKRLQTVFAQLIIIHQSPPWSWRTRFNINHTTSNVVDPRPSVLLLSIAPQ